MRSLAPPGLLVCDGAPSCLRAAAQVWPGTAVQRCLVHTLRNTFTDLTRNPRSEAGRELLAHIRKLPRIHGARQLAHAPRRLHQGTHVRQGRSRQPQGQSGTHMVVDP